MNVFEQVRHLVAETTQEPLERITAATVLRDYLDSLGVIELTLGVEEAFQIDVPETIATEFESRVRTVGELASFIGDHLGQNSAAQAA